MRLALGSGFEYEATDLPMEQAREYRLCTLLHKTPSELDHEPSKRLDWLLAVDTAVTRAKEDAQERINRR